MHENLMNARIMQNKLNFIIQCDILIQTMYYTDRFLIVTCNNYIRK